MDSSRPSLSRRMCTLIHIQVVHRTHPAPPRMHPAPRMFRRPRPRVVRTPMDTITGTNIRRDRNGARMRRLRRLNTITIPQVPRRMRLSLPMRPMHRRTLRLLTLQHLPRTTLGPVINHRLRPRLSITRRDSLRLRRRCTR